ncbi:MAG: LLM class flavin-dependent oxidoreductase [Dehalococcoidia bacterium]
MKFGIMLPNSGPLAQVESIKQVARQAEGLGFDSVWIHDHITYDRDWFIHRMSGLIEQTESGLEPDFYESLMTLTYVAGITERVKLGTGILVLPLRNPLVLGRQAMTMQALCKGRLLLGVGLGDYLHEFDVMNVPYQDRAPITNEYLEILTRIFAGGEVSYEGKTIRFRKASFLPRVSSIPLLIGGGTILSPEPKEDHLSLPVLRRVAKWGHGWLPEGSPRLIEMGVKKIQELAKEYGRENIDFEIAAFLPLYIADDELATRKTARSMETEFFSVRKGMEISLIGSPSTIVKKLEEYRDAGTTTMVIRCWAESLDSFLDMMHIFATEIAPSFG